MGAHWRNYGYGPELGHDGIVRIVHHPGECSRVRSLLNLLAGEVWFKYNLDVMTPWVKVDVRRNSKGKAQYERVLGDDGVINNTLSCDLPELVVEPDTIDNPRFTLYEAPIPICKAKYDDLISLLDYLPESKRDYYRNLPTDASKKDLDENLNAFDTESEDESDNE
jgi:hypothetical protein